MIRTSVLSLLPALALVVVLGARRAPEGPSLGTEIHSAADPRVDSARVEVASGRFWHAARLLRAVSNDGVVLAPEESLLLARADLAWRNWDGIVVQVDGEAWLDEVGGGEGWLLLARAREARDEPAAAAAAYARYLSTPHASTNRLLPGVRARQARTLASAGQSDEAMAALDQVAAVPVVVSWGTLDVASVLADSGRTDQVSALLERVTDRTARLQGWELLPTALLAAGDSAGAEAAYRSAAQSVTGSRRRARAWAITGDLTQARGDLTGAREAYLRALGVGVSTPATVRAARRVLPLLGRSADEALLVARALARSDDRSLALSAYDLHTDLRGGVSGVAERVRLARARILAVTAGREEDAVREFRALSTSAQTRVGAPALESWARLRTRQGRTEDVQTLRGWLLERYPSSAEAVDVVFFRGDDAHDNNDLEAAIRDYQRVRETVPDQDRAGLATMRSAQIHLVRQDPARAAQVYEDYLTEFPSGRRWQEASYWAARTRLSLGDSARARALIRRLRGDDPFSYYTVIAADLLGERFQLDLPPGQEGSRPDWLVEGLFGLDQLTEGGFRDGADAEAERLVARARGDAGAMMHLAEELILRGRADRGINIAFDLRQRGASWTERLAKIVYPFQYQNVFLREAAEDGVDPYLTAALARQESAFVPDIRSSANAVGLMQLLPETAQRLARSVGPEGFREELLEVPDVNVHLGTLYLRGLLREHQGDVTRFLAAYNAGPHRVVRWLEFIEAGDPLTFIERIPFAETRNYVKLVQRNVAVYRQLYGGTVGPTPPR